MCFANLRLAVNVALDMADKDILVLKYRNKLALVHYTGFWKDPCM